MDEGVFLLTAIRLYIWIKKLFSTIFTHFRSDYKVDIYSNIWFYYRKYQDLTYEKMRKCQYKCVTIKHTPHYFTLYTAYKHCIKWSCSWVNEFLSEINFCVTLERHAIRSLKTAVNTLRIKEIDTKIFKTDIHFCRVLRWGGMYSSGVRETTPSYTCF